MDTVIVEQCEYQEDRVIDGTLHYFFEGDWHEYDKKDLTTMLLGEQDMFNTYVDHVYSKYVN